MDTHDVAHNRPYRRAPGSRRTVKQYRTISTQSWIQFLFLAATGVCFGLLIVISRVERQTSINVKRDVARVEEAQGLVRRQDVVDAETVSYVLYSSTSSASAAVTIQTANPTTSQPAGTTSAGTTVSAESASADDILSLTSQLPSSTPTEPAMSASATDILSLTSQSTSKSSAPDVSAATASATDILSLTSSPTASAPEVTESESFFSLDMVASATVDLEDPSATSIAASLSASASSKVTVGASATVSGFASSNKVSPTASAAQSGTPDTSDTSKPSGPSDSATDTESTGSTSKTIDPTIDANLYLFKLTFKNYYYFYAMYLPKIIAVIMSTLWGIIFVNLRLMEPFYQLSAQSGAIAKDTMFGNYLASSFSISSLSAALQGQWVLVLGGSILLAWLAVVAIVSELMTIVSTATCTDGTGRAFRCAPGWAVNKSVLYFLLGVVALIFVLEFVLACLIMRRKRSGVSTDPSSIAAMAELLGNPDVMQDLREIDPSASDEEVKRNLAGNRYRLGFYHVDTGKQNYSGLPATDDDGGQRYGLIKVAGDELPHHLAKGERYSYGAVTDPTIDEAAELRINARRRHLQLIYDIIMLLTAIATFIIVLYYYLDSTSSVLNNFFNSGKFGPRLVLTSLALIVSTGWSDTSQGLTLMAPYRSMAVAMSSQSGVPASRSILTSTACNPFTAVYKGLKLRNYLVTSTAIAAILGDILLIAVSGIPYSSGQILPSLQASSFATLAILTIMAANSVAVIIHNRTSAGGTRRLPRKPDTLINVWLYLCGSQLAQHDEHDQYEQSNQPLDQRGLTSKYGAGYYGFARARGVDGIFRWTVDGSAELQSTKHAMTQHTSGRPPRHVYTASQYSIAGNPYGEIDTPRDTGIEPTEHERSQRQPEMHRYEPFRPRDHNRSQQRCISQGTRYSSADQQQHGRGHGHYATPSDSSVSEEEDNSRGYSAQQFRRHSGYR